MSQLSLHAITGLYMNKVMLTGAEEEQARRGAFRFGVVAGNMLPDYDFLLVAPLYFFNSSLALSLHRSWSHSLLVQALLAWLLQRFWARSDAVRGASVRGLWLGMAAHSIADIFLWFSHVDLLWPLSRFGLPSDVNLWAWLVVPDVVSNLLGAADYLLWGALFGWLGALARQQRTDLRMLRYLRGWGLLFYALGAGYVLLSFLLPEHRFNLYAYSLLILLVAPAGTWGVWQMRQTIAQAPSGPGGRAAA